MKTNVARLCFALFLITCVQLFSNFIKFKDSVTVSGGIVTMKDVAEETDVPSEVLERIIVAYVPTGASTRLDKRTLVNLLRRHVKELRVEFGESNFVFVENRRESEQPRDHAVALTSEASAIEVALDILSGQYPTGTKFTLQSRTGSLHAHTSFSVSVSTTTKDAPSVRFTLRDRNRVVGYLVLSFTAVLEREVAFANRRINKGEVVGHGDVEFRSVNVLALSKTPVFEEQLPLVATKSFVKNEMLDGKYTEEVPTLLKGQLTKAVSNVGGVSASVLVQALEDGRIGNVVSVRNLTTGNVLKGTVLGDGTVLVLEVK